MRLRTLAPIRCPHCRGPLRPKKWLPAWVKWCGKCRCTVQYLDDEQLQVWDL